MAENNNEIITTVDDNVGGVMSASMSSMTDPAFDISALAARADRIIADTNKIMRAVLKLTTERDWVIIGGKPYLQEAGASNVARAFGISYRVCDGFPVREVGADGYPSFVYRMVFEFGNQRIEMEGGRSASDEFFIGPKTDRDGNPKKQKSVDEIDMMDVRRAAYTNCLGRGVKTILPGLRNLGVNDLEEAGLDTKKIQGYTFKTGTRGGNSGRAEDSGLTCSRCGAAITQAEASYSEGHYGKRLCRRCQKVASVRDLDLDDTEPVDGPPLPDDADDPRGGGR